MTDFGFIRAAAATPVVHVARPVLNAKEIVSLMRGLAGQGVSVAVFPELSISGYSCGDLFTHGSLVRECEDALAELLVSSADIGMVAVVGAPVRLKGRLFDCGVVIRSGEILGVVPKTCVSSSESRWFSSADVLPEFPLEITLCGQPEVMMGTGLLFELGGTTFGVEIGGDLYAAVPVSSAQAAEGAQLILNLAADKEIRGVEQDRRLAVSSCSRRLCAAYVYSSCGYGESTQDAVWAGASIICENGGILAESRLFQRNAHCTIADVDIDRVEKLRVAEGQFKADAVYGNFCRIYAGEAAETDFSSCLKRDVDPHPFLPAEYGRTMSGLVNALCTRMEHIGSKKAVLGVSGGLDSTLALLVVAEAFDAMGLPRENIIGITMPGFGTSRRTHDNSSLLMEALGISSREISIVPAVRQHFSDIGHSESVQDLTYENSQARERTQILMDVAGKEGGLVIGTGDLSELALGWCTYNGDHMSMYAVNAGIPKTLVHALVEAAAGQEGISAELSSVLKDIAATPISPELVPTDDKGEIRQKTEDLVGPYELHDFFIYNHLVNGFCPEKLAFLAEKAFEGRYDTDTINHWLESFKRRFRTQQFKRSCLPDGPQTEAVSLSPRGGWTMPSDI